MISVEESYPGYAQRCHELQDGQSAYSCRSEIPYDIHCYRDGWHVMWKSPPNGQLGRLLSTKEELASFLHGKWAVGRPIKRLIGLRRYLNS